MRIEYTKTDGLQGDECWIAHDDEKSTRYKRIACGIVLPREEQPQACILVLGEVYQSAKEPPKFRALQARVGSWPEIEQGLGEFRQKYKMGIVVTEPEEEESAFLKGIPDLRWASDKIPLSIVPAPKHSLTETVRQRVDGFINQKRLHLEAVRNVLDQAASQGARTLQCLITWLSDHPAYYKAPCSPKVPPSPMCA